jgi:CRP/FNR family transcriptional regulator, cyclic AMP receptor protein
MPTPLAVFQNDPMAEPFTAGQTLFSQGDPGDHMYVVLSGEVDLKIGDATVETVTSGGLFGEMALIDHRDRSASAIGKSDGVVVPVNQKRFLYLVQNTPFFAVEVMEVMADRLRRMNDATLGSGSATAAAEPAAASAPPATGATAAPATPASTE